MHRLCSNIGIVDKSCSGWMKLGNTLLFSKKFRTPNQTCEIVEQESYLFLFHQLFVSNNVKTIYTSRR